MSQARVVIASNRGPVSFVERDGTFETKRGAGGLAGAMDPVARTLQADITWIAAATSASDRKALRAGSADDLQDELGYPLTLLDLDPEAYANYYDAVSNRLLWFANHCLWDELDIERHPRRELDAWARGYVPVNDTFADAIARRAASGASVLVQDYHLALVPRLLRERRTDLAILHFTHSSFCGTRGLGQLPDEISEGVVRGMLGANLVGVHVNPWARGFFEACHGLGATIDVERGRVVLDGRETWVRTYPIHVDVAGLRSRAASPAARAWAERFSAERLTTLLVRADRIEPSKNIIRGFEAFGRLLDRRHDLAGETRFVACLYPSRLSMPEYRAYADSVRNAAAEVNDRHPGAIALFMEDDFDRTLGSLVEADVLVVNPLMDGMNLVSKEGVALNRRAAALVLSTRAGSFDELGEEAIAIHDPADVGETERALEIAVDMDWDERRRRSDRLREVVEGRVTEDWIAAQMRDLEAVSAGKAPLTPPPGGSER